MKLETFIEKFDQFADAPDSVAKMRELILDLAVQGRLSNQNTEKETVESRYLDEPLSSNIPSNWRLLNFGKFCDIQGGNQPPKSQFSDRPKPGYVRLFQIRDLGERPVPVYIPEDSTKRFCREGEILIGRYGASVGKIFWAQDGAYNVALAKFLYPEDALLPEFAFRVLKSHYFQAKIAGASRSAQAGFNKGDLASINFPLPPLAEQKRIVAKVDELMALCDRLEAQQQERDTQQAALARASLARFADEPTPANLNFLFHSSYHIPPSDLRKSILTLAVQGKLVPQDPNDEAAEKWIKNLPFHKRKTGKTELNVEPLHVPDTWLGVTMNDVFEVVGGIQKTPDRSPRSNAFPYLGVGNVYRGRLDLSSVKEFELREGELDKRRLEPGDLLIIEGNGSIDQIGRCARWNGEIPNCVHQNHVIRCRPYDVEIGPFVLLFLNSPSGMAIMQELAITSSGLYSLSVGKIKCITIPVPPAAEQSRIVAKVDELMALVDELETQLLEARTTAKHLLEALVAELTFDSASSPAVPA